jgi:hypothetical protein
VFQAYSSYWPDGYTAQYAYAAAWMCKYDPSACPEAIATFNGAMKINNMKYGLGYDYDSVMPGVAAVLVTLKLEPVAEVAKTYLEGYVLAKWEVRGVKFEWAGWSLTAASEQQRMMRSTSVVFAVAVVLQLSIWHAASISCWHVFCTPD